MKQPTTFFRRPALLLSLLVGLVAASPLAAEDKVLLKTQWKPGFVYKMDQVLDQDMKMGEMGNTKAKVNFGMGVKSMSTDKSGETKLAINMNRMDMVMDMKMAGQDMHIDTRDASNPQAKQMKQMFEPLLNAEMVAIMGADGELKEITGLDSLGAAPGIGQMMDKNAFSQMLTQDAVMNFPKEPVPAGHKWKIDHQMEMMKMKMSLTGDAEVSAIEKVSGDDVATIKMSGELKFDKDAFKNVMKAAADAASKESGKPTPPELDKQMEAMMPDVKAIKMTMELKFNATQGMVMSTDATTKAKMSMNIPEKGKMEMDMDQRIKATVTAEESK
jgi:hypothetical protein